MLNRSIGKPVGFHRIPISQPDDLRCAVLKIKSNFAPYKSRVFTDTYSADIITVNNAEQIILGGTGYGLDNRLPDEVEHTIPDYFLYPQFLRTAYGFLTRGCPRNCGFCIVSDKEGRRSHKVADLSEFWTGQEEIKLMDANLLACPDHEKLIEQLIQSRAMVDFTQGLDIRLTTKDNVSLLNRVRTKAVHFAWDDPNVDLTPYFLRFLEYCAAKNQDWKTISPSDLESVLRSGKSHLYTFSSISETRWVVADNPETPDVVEQEAEFWYIYTIKYNGEAYFADTIFHLSDEQKVLADDYAWNLSLFFGDGMFQGIFSDEAMTGIPTLGDVTFSDGATEVLYFNQLDERYCNEPYGTDHIGGYGCGPTAMSIVVSSLTSDTVDPVEMSVWAYENGYWCSKSGSYHSLIPRAAQHWDLPVAGCTVSEPQRIIDALAEGKLVVALMAKGHFTSSGHFIVLRGVQDEKILVADPSSYNRSQKSWDLSIIVNEASRCATAGGPFWIIG